MYLWFSVAREALRRRYHMLNWSVGGLFGILVLFWTTDLDQCIRIWLEPIKESSGILERIPYGWDRLITLSTWIAQFLWHHAVSKVWLMEENRGIIWSLCMTFCEEACLSRIFVAWILVCNHVVFSCSCWLMSGERVSLGFWINLSHLLALWSVCVGNPEIMAWG